MTEQISLFDDIPNFPRQAFVPPVLGKDRAALVRVAMDTMEIMKHLDNRYKEAVLFKGNEPNNDASAYEQNGAGIVQVIDADVLDVAEIFIGSNPCILNFGNAHNPGGGWLNGAIAQEECIARRSSLIKSIGDNPMYLRNRAYTKTPYYLDDMIYSPRIRVLKDAQYNRLAKDEEFDVAVVTGAAVNMYSTYIINNPDVVQAQVDKIMERRIVKVLDIMASYGHRCIVLGAWGCGAFGQDTYRVAEYFHKVLFEQGFAKCFDNIVFAIYNDQPKIKVFEEVFAGKLFGE